jgi:hypothetical protein
MNMIETGPVSSVAGLCAVHTGTPTSNPKTMKHTLKIRKPSRNVVMFLSSWIGIAIRDYKGVVVESRHPPEPLSCIHFGKDLAASGHYSLAIGR